MPIYKLKRKKICAHCKKEIKGNWKKRNYRYYHDRFCYIG